MTRTIATLFLVAAAGPAHASISGWCNMYHPQTCALVQHDDLLGRVDGHVEVWVACGQCDCDVGLDACDCREQDLGAVFVNSDPNAPPQGDAGGDAAAVDLGRPDLGEPRCRFVFQGIDGPPVEGAARPISIPVPLGDVSLLLISDELDGGWETQTQIRVVEVEDLPPPTPEPDAGEPPPPPPPEPDVGVEPPEPDGEIVALDPDVSVEPPEPDGEIVALNPDVGDPAPVADGDVPPDPDGAPDTEQKADEDDGCAVRAGRSTGWALAPLLLLGLRRRRRQSQAPGTTP